MATVARIADMTMKTALWGAVGFGSFPIVLFYVILVA